jgi:hypothetical protein
VALHGSVCFGLFCKTPKFFSGLFRCFGPVSKQPKQTQLNLFRLFFSVCGSPPKILSFSPSVFWSGIETTETNKTYGMGNLKGLYFNKICCFFGWSFVCFGCFKTPKLPVLILKRNNRNKCLVSDSAETSFSSSFGCFDMKLVSEDTLVANVSKLMGDELQQQGRSTANCSQPFPYLYCKTVPRQSVHQQTDHAIFRPKQSVHPMNRLL